MDAGETVPHGESPAKEYSRQLHELQHAQAIDQKRERRFGYLKVAIVLFVIVMGLLFLRDRIVLESLLAPAAFFVVLVVLHEKLLRSMGLRARAIRFYERGLARVEDRWAGAGETGDRFLILCTRMRATWISSAKRPCSSCSAPCGLGPAKRRWPHGCWLPRL